MFSVFFRGFLYVLSGLGLSDILNFFGGSDDSETSATSLIIRLLSYIVLGIFGIVIVNIWQAKKGK